MRARQEGMLSLSVLRRASETSRAPCSTAPDISPALKSARLRSQSASFLLPRDPSGTDGSRASRATFRSSLDAPPSYLKQLWEPGRGEIVTQPLMGEARGAKHGESERFYFLAAAARYILSNDCRLVPVDVYIDFIHISRDAHHLDTDRCFSSLRVSVVSLKSRVTLRARDNVCDKSIEFGFEIRF